MTRGRDAALDNLKGLLIISVVYVHLYDMLGQKTPLLFTIRTIVLAVQMPLFLFLCGYFGKHAEKRRDAAWAEYLLPFLLFNTLYYLVRAEQEPGMQYVLLRPLNMYWFLLTLLIIRVLMPELLRIRWLLPISLAVALLAGIRSSGAICRCRERFVFCRFICSVIFARPRTCGAYESFRCRLRGSVRLPVRFWRCG